MTKATKELTTIQRLNRLPIGTVIMFNTWKQDGTTEPCYLEKIEANGTCTTYGRGKEPFWKILYAYRTYCPKNRIPDNFIILAEEEVEIMRLEDKIKEDEKYLDHYLDWVVDKAKKNIEEREKRIEELRAQLQAKIVVEVA